MSKNIQKMPKVAKVKDKSPAEIQITAEQLLREAKERELEIVPPPPKQKVSDPEELKEYRLKRRKAFEDNIRKNRGSITNWLKYAKWEEEQGEMQRARSVYERALDVDYRNITIWLKYAEMEMKSRQINHSRNVWDRAVTILPRVNQFWYKYTYMEEMLRNTAGARQVFERWMEWEPDQQAWQTYINFEMRYQELKRARNIYERFVITHPDPKNWIRHAKFEENHGFVQNARKVYESAAEFFGDDHLDESLFVAFAKFEESQKEHDRAKSIYKFALEKMPKEKCLHLYNEFTKYEKKYGDKTAIDDVIVSKRRFQYEESLKEDQFNYDTWVDYICMLEDDGNEDLIREVYERAITVIPPVRKKQYWGRYIYLWIYYALYEEMTSKDVERARQVYQMCLQVVPHKVFTFAKIWLLYAKFEIRQGNLTVARKSLGQALGTCPKHKLFRGYIELELKLREFNRCRKLYEQWLIFDSERCNTWIQFANLEDMLNDMNRCRGVFELAVDQAVLDMPEYLWKAYIDFEIEQEEWDRVRVLYKRLLTKTNHVKVWISYAKFENSMQENEKVSNCRDVYKRANKELRDSDKEHRLILLESWKEFEEECGNEESLAKVNKIMPQKITKRHQVTQNGQTSWEEITDYMFPDDESANPSLLMLVKKAKEWREKEENIDRDDSDVEIDTGSEDEDSE